MLEIENIVPEKIAYDRPSEKLIKFLLKYYNLKDYLPQNNNYVIFDEYFINRKQAYNDNNNYTNTNTKSANSNRNLNYDDKSQANQIALAATSSMVNINSKRMYFLLIRKFKL